VPAYELAQAQTLVKFAHQNQTAVGSYSHALEVDLQRAVEGELKGLFLRLTHRHSTSYHSDRIQTRIYQGSANVVSNW
jgi:hypothetical protein